MLLHKAAVSPSSPSTPSTVSEAQDGGPISAGLLIFRDLAFPEPFRHLVSDGVELILVPSWRLIKPAEEGDPSLSTMKHAGGMFLQTPLPIVRTTGNTAAVASSNSSGYIGGISTTLSGRLNGTDDDATEVMLMLNSELVDLTIMDQVAK